MENDLTAKKEEAGVSVFISYSHEKKGSSHKERVDELGKALEEEGFVVILDQQHHKEPAEGWATWSAKLQQADHVLVVLSENYGKTQGSEFEQRMLAVLKQLGAPDHRFTQVFFDQRYKDQDFLLKHIKPYLGSNNYDLCEKPIAGNPRWKSLLKRIQASAKETQAQVAVKEAEIKAKRGHGVILVGDIVDFSGDRFKPNEQSALMKHLWKWLHEHRLWRGWKLYLDSTLDGAIIVFDTNHGDGENCIEYEALELAQEWIKFVTAGAGVPSLKGKKVGFRVGIDAGNYEIFDLPEEAGQMKRTLSEKIVGTGPNDCDRLTRLAGDSDIVVSEDFVRALKRQDQNPKWVQHFYPSLNEVPSQAFPKAYRAQDFRLFTGHKPGEKVEMPKILRELQAATDQITKILEQVAEEYWEGLYELAAVKLEKQTVQASKGKAAKPQEALWKQTLNAENALLRVSFFLPDPQDHENRLRCSLFRVTDPDLSEEQRGRIPVVSQTVYSITGEGQGPAGHAYVSKKPFVHFGLPDADAEWEKYLKKMQPLGMTEAECLKSSRHARSFMCFPCSLGDLTPEAVVCIDGMTSLELFSKNELLNVADYLQRRFGLVLALLSKVRR